jgi:hypothetical protein
LVGQLKEKHRVRVSDNSVLRRILGAKRNEITVEWGKLHD